MNIFKKISSSVSSVIKAVTPQITVDPNKDLRSLVDKATPDITLGDPSKLLTKPIEGLQNATGSIASNALDNVGQVLSNPNAGAVLGAAGAYFGIPNLGNLAGSLSQNKYPEPGSAEARTVQLPYEKDNTNLIIGSVIGGVVILITIVFISRKKR